MADRIEHDTAVDLSGLMAVLSEHLYSTPNVAIRELVQNAHDSIERRGLLDPSAFASEEPRIEVVADEVNHSITITDNGSGLTRSEVIEFLATVGSSGTGALREAGNDDLIGMFGLGFLSAFAVAKNVTVVTTSFSSPAETWCYQSADAFTYSLESTPATHRIGTQVRLDLTPEHHDLAALVALENLLSHYCQLLKHPIVFGDQPAINIAPPWRDPTCGPAEYLAFAKTQADWFKPMAAMPLVSETPPFRGTAWIHDRSSYGNSDNRELSVYLRGMLVTDNDRDLLPRWAGFIGGAIEVPHLAPTASRETLQRDSEYTELQVAISDQLVTSLLNMAQSDPASWQQVVHRHGTALIQAAIVDDRLFALLADHVRVPTSHGDLLVSELAHGRRIHVGASTQRSVGDLMFVAQGIPLARGQLLGVLPFLRRYANERSMVLVETGSPEGTAALFEPVEVPAEDSQWLQDVLAAKDEQVVIANFEPATLPIMIMPDPDAELQRKIAALERPGGPGSAALSLARIHTDQFADLPLRRVYLNNKNGLIEHLLAVRGERPAAAMQVATILRSYKTIMLASDLDRSGQSELNLVLEESAAVLNGLLLGGQP